MLFNRNTSLKSKIPAPIRHEIALKSIQKEQPNTEVEYIRLRCDWYVVIPDMNICRIISHESPISNYF